MDDKAIKSFMLTNVGRYTAGCISVAGWWFDSLSFLALVPVSRSSADISRDKWYKRRHSSGFHSLKVF